VEDYPIYLYPGGRLDCSYLDLVWTWRIAFFPSQIAIEFFLAVGLLMIVHPIHCIRKIYSQSSARPILYNAMTSAFFIAVSLNAFEFLENLGTEATGMQLAYVPLTCAV
jgi:hypothetical protein